MTTPEDFAPDRVLEVDQPAPPDTRGLSKQVWVSRLLGVILLFGALGILGANEGVGSAAFFIDASVLIGMAAYVVIAEARTRRLSINLEKRLRLGLLVHNMELESMAMQDDLTQLFNRRYFFERLERQLETARAFKRPLAVIVADLDSMKTVNDTYGHRVGDEVLAAFGRFLLDHTRASDVPARTGGDEFAIILPDTTERAAVTLKNRLAKRLESMAMAEQDGAEITVKGSFGVGCYPTSGETVDELMNRADADMYADKGTHGLRRRSSDKATAAAPLQLGQAEA